jgi:hypothetical protein
VSGQRLRPEGRHDMLMDVNPMGGTHDLSPDEWAIV